MDSLFESVGKDDCLWRELTHIVRAKDLSIRRVFKQKPFESENFKQSILVLVGKISGLERVHMVITDNFLEDSVKLVEDFNPGIEIGAGPLPD